jgi:hypothetical protein
MGFGAVRVAGCEHWQLFGKMNLKKQRISVGVNLATGSDRVG